MGNFFGNPDLVGVIMMIVLVVLVGNQYTEKLQGVRRTVWWHGGAALLEMPGRCSRLAGGREYVGDQKVYVPTSNNNSMVMVLFKI